ncbi:MAG: condensation domain-containing protein, partial [Burkholderiaceae bacterium]
MGSQQLQPGLSGGAWLPLSLSQREVWLDQRAWPGSEHLNIGGTGFLLGELDVDCLERALQGLVDECEALRLVPQADGRQRLLAQYRAPLERVDLRGSAASGEDMLETLRAYGQRRIAEPFAQGERPPWRFLLLIGGERLHGLSIQFHHTVMDGWGTSQVIRRWSEWYGALRQGRVPEPGGRPGAYQAFIAASLDYRRSEAFQRDAQFWAGQFAAHQEALATPLLERRHGPPTPARLPAAHLVRQPLPRAAYVQTGARLAAQGHTVAGALLAALLVYFWRCSGRAQLVVGLPSLNRSGALNKQLPGMFVGLMALPLACRPEQQGGELLARLGAQVGAALRHARYPLSELAQQLQLLRLGRDAVADVLLSMERQDYEVG